MGKVLQHRDTKHIVLDIVDFHSKNVLVAEYLILQFIALGNGGKLSILINV